MNCPNCGHGTNDVIASRAETSGKVIRRRRCCRECGHRWTTYEIHADAMRKLQPCPNETQRKLVWLVSHFLVEAREVLAEGNGENARFQYRGADE